MSGRHRNEFPDENPGDGGYDASTPPVFGVPSESTASSDWFSPRTSQPPQGPPSGPSGPAAPRGQAGGSAETPEWFSANDSEPPTPYASGGYGTPGAGRPGRPGRTPAQPPRQAPPRQQAGGRPGAPGGGSGSYGAPGRSGPAASGGNPASASGGFQSDGYSVYDSIQSSGGGPTGAGRPDRSGGYAAGGSGAFASGGYAAGSGAYGAGDSGSYGSGGYGSGGSGGYGGGSGSGEYGGRRRGKRSKGALIGPMAGAVGLAMLLGIGVYAFAEIGGGCSGDDSIALSVSAAPEIAPAITKAVKRFNESGPEVSGNCVEATVTSADPAAVQTLVTGQGVTTGASKRPDVWIPDSSLWISMVQAKDKAKESVKPTKTSVAQSPIVVGMPQELAVKLKSQGIIAQPSWDNLLSAAGGTAGGAVTKNQMIPPNLIRLQVPDPARTATGLGSLVLTNILLTNDPAKDAIFTGIVRTVRESTTPSVKAEFASFKPDRQGRYPVILAPEQAVYQHNTGKPAEAAVAVYPSEGTLSMDYPFTITTLSAEKSKAAKMLEQAMTTEATAKDVQELGFRTSKGKAPATFGPKTGVSPQKPRPLPTPQPAAVQQISQAWSKLSLSIRMLSMIDVSGSMNEQVAPGVTRWQATAKVAQGGLSLMPKDTELGQWVFSTKIDGKLDYKEIVPIGPLEERIGSVTRRQRIQGMLSTVEPEPNGDTGLYDSILAAFKYMKKTYKPEFGNSILLLTDGKNDDPDGPTLSATLKALEAEYDPNKPVQVIMIGFGSGVDVNELKQIAKATRGSVHIAHTPEEIRKIFLQALSRRAS